MKIAVLGVGGVGGYFGGRLQAAGHSVAFLARGAHLEALRSDGLRLDSVNGDLHLSPVTATDRPEEVGPVDCVIVAVKAWQLPSALASLRPLMAADTVVLPLLNGVESVDTIAAAVGHPHVLGGVAWIRSEIAGPGRIRHSGVDPRISVGEPAGGLSPRVEALAATFREAGLRTEAADDIQSVLWAKLVFIAPTSAVGAATRSTIDVFRAVPETRAMVITAIEEAVAVGRARGATLGDDVIDKTVSWVDGLAAGSTSSMHRDIVGGRPSELDTQIGAVVRLGRQSGAPTPVSAVLYGTLLPQEQAARRAAGLEG
jgi:2-dehydropantoate 2-reductase